VNGAACERWFELSIMADGRAALCCMDGAGDFTIGDTRERSLLEIYNRPEALAARRALASRRGSEPCGRCTY